MSTIAGCRALIRQYQALRAAVLDVSRHLDVASESANQVYLNIKDIYIVDDEVTPITTRAHALDTDIEKTSNYLKNNIVSAIDAEIAALYREIARLEEEARRAAEEAERRRSEEAAKSSGGSSGGGTTAMVK